MRRDSRYKIVVRTNGAHELYDMVEDPLEYKNLYPNPEYQAQFYELSMKTLQWLIHTSDIVPHPSADSKPWYAD